MLVRKARTSPGAIRASRTQREEGALSGPPKPALAIPGASRAQESVSQGSQSPALPEPGTTAGSGCVWEFTPTARRLSWNSCLCLPQVPSKSFLPGAGCSAAPLSTHRQAERGLQKKTKPKAFESFNGWSWVTHRSTSPCSREGTLPPAIDQLCPSTLS